MMVQRVPDGLGQMPPGPELAALLASLDVTRIANEDLPVVADVMIGLLDGRFHGRTTGQIIADLLAATPADPPSGQPAASNTAGESARAGHDQPSEPITDDNTADHTTDVAALGAGRGVGVEVSVELATLLGRDDHPATLPGLGPILADVARRIVARQRRAEWRYCLVDDGGYFVFGGITRRRPTHTRDTTDGGLVELLIPLALLDHLAAHPDETGQWRGVIDDITAQYRNRHQHLRRIDAHPDRRFPTTALRRHVQLRDRTCKGPGCRRPASASEHDHTQDYRHGGATTSTNGGPFCTHDHDLKTRGGWRLTQPQPGTFTWHTPLGQTHTTRGQPLIHPEISQEDADKPPF